ncbi:hypothetical protein EKH79_03370 [Dyella dinghuensis]|uniref:SRPBCC domain-containing protein n=1 Tax=Dyella dinghuensis TaxID=1920169 RepID=A0A3S0RF41_9GAMM|nr:SRPBCC family protein [Dyella dinghuensis]RUL65764.1 hypothetical protein EKH79_03370 [Dyella dinghuensis]
MSAQNSVRNTTQLFGFAAVLFAVSYWSGITRAQTVQAPQAGSAASTKIAGTMKDDLKNRSHDIHWPNGFDPEKADLFSHNELVIHASCERVWKHIIDADKWPQWYPNSKDVRIIGISPVLVQGTVFRWTTFGLPLESKVNEYVPYSRIGWYGYTPGTRPTFYHTWYLTPAGNACDVVMDEVGKGAAAAHLRETDESLMHRGHDLWLATLKWVSEGP